MRRSTSCRTHHQLEHGLVVLCYCFLLILSMHYLLFILAAATSRDILIPGIRFRVFGFIRLSRTVVESVRRAAFGLVLDVDSISYNTHRHTYMHTKASRAAYQRKHWQCYCWAIPAVARIAPCRMGGRRMQLLVVYGCMYNVCLSADSFWVPRGRRLVTDISSVSCLTLFPQAIQQLSACLRFTLLPFSASTQAATFSRHRAVLLGSPTNRGAVLSGLVQSGPVRSDTCRCRRRSSMAVPCSSLISVTLIIFCLWRPSWFSILSSSSSAAYPVVVEAERPAQLPCRAAMRYATVNWPYNWSSFWRYSSDEVTAMSTVLKIYACI